jgi:hypothetical protein
MDCGANMIPNAIQMQPENLMAAQCPDWFDDIHDTIRILQDRDDEENGFSSQPQVASYAA